MGLIQLGTSCLDLVQAGGGRDLCAQRGNSYRRKRKEGEGEASSLSDSTECNVGCRAVVLLHVMLLLSWVSRDKKSCCTTVHWDMSLWYCLDGGRPRAGAWGHGLCCPGTKGWGRDGNLVTLPGERSPQCSALLFQIAVNSWKFCIWGHMSLPCQLIIYVTGSNLNHSACVTGL